MNIKERFLNWFGVMDVYRPKLPTEIYNWFEPFLEKEWNNSNMPRNDTKIIRWHKIHKCPIVVFYRPGISKASQCDWIDGTMSNSWPEEAFIENLWQPLPKPPQQ